MVIRHSWQRLLGESGCREQFPFTPLICTLHEEHHSCRILLYLETTLIVDEFFHQGAPAPRVSGYYRLWDWRQHRIPTTVKPAQHNSVWLLHAVGCHSLCRHLLWPLAAKTVQYSRNGRETFVIWHSKLDTSLYAVGPLSRLPVHADSWCREESPGETIHSLDQLRETTGTSHTCYCLHTHTHTLFNVGGLTIPLQLLCHILK